MDCSTHVLRVTQPLYPEYAFLGHTLPFSMFSESSIVLPAVQPVPRSLPD